MVLTYVDAKTTEVTLLVLLLCSFSVFFILVLDESETNLYLVLIGLNGEMQQMNSTLFNQGVSKGHKKLV